jgi:hypothetical protein
MKFPSGPKRNRDLSFFRQVGATEDRYYLAGLAASAALGTATPAIGTLIAVPFHSGRGGVIDRLAFTVTGVGGAGSVARVGIYLPTSASDLTPAGLVLDGGEFDSNSTGLKAATVSQALSPDGLYWFAYLCGVAAPTIRAVPVGDAFPILGVNNAFGTTPILGWTVAQAYGALPATFPAGATGHVTATPAIGVRYSA